MLALWVDQLLGFAAGALAAIRQDERYPSLMSWAREEGPACVGGDKALAQALAPEDREFLEHGRQQEDPADEQRDAPAVSTRRSRSTSFFPPTGTLLWLFFPRLPLPRTGVSASTSTRTVVSDDHQYRASGTSSNPTTRTSEPTAIPASWNARITPSAIASLWQMIPSGGGLSRRRRRARSKPAALEVSQ